MSDRASVPPSHPDRFRGRRAVVLRPFRVLLLASLATACGPLPRPFEHQRVSALLSDQRALVPVAVQPVDGAPGLAEAVSTALNRDEIAASTENPGDGFLILSGKIRSDDGKVQLVWQITSGDAHPITEFHQPLSAESLNPAHRNDLAEAAAQGIAHALRGDDSGAADIEAAPKVALQGVKTPADFDNISLSQAMVRALGLQGLTVVSTHPSFVVDGTLQIGPMLAGQNLVTVDWTVRDAAGRDLGTVSQGSPVPHERLLGPLTGLVRDIAEAGAEGIAEVIRKQANRRQSETQ